MKRSNNEITAMIESQIATLKQEHDGLASVLLGQGFIVECRELPLVFDVSADGKVTNPRPCGSPGQATRFSRRDAEAIAATVVNGNGDKGAAAHVRVAVDAAMKRAQDLLAKLVPVDAQPS